MKREDIRLMAMAEIAERLRVTRERAGQIASSRDNGFPDPIARLKAGKIYLADEVEAWIAVHRPHLNEQDEEA